MATNDSGIIKQNAHPLYTAKMTTWQMLWDCYHGEEAIKDKGPMYLPPTTGMWQDGYGSANGRAQGNIDYDAYLKRSYFPTVFEEAVDTAVGTMHKKPATISLPKELEALLDVATDDGEDLQLLLRKINSYQLISGRLGLLGTFREVDGELKPVLIVHKEESVYNWDDTQNEDSSQNLRMVQIDESCNVLTNEFTWKWENKSRVLALIDNSGKIVGFDEYGNVEKGTYAAALLKEGQSILEADFQPLSIKGRTATKIPFTFINSKDLSSEPDKAPLDGLARLSLAIYRGEADYRQNLFMQGQDTLVQIGANSDEDDVVRIGAGARIDLPVNGDAKFIGVSGDGLSEQRSALENDYTKADKKTSKLMVSGNNESGEALKIRIAAQTATLPQIAMAAAAGLSKVLKDMAVWVGANPDEVIVEPNLDFSNGGGNGQTLQQILIAKEAGAPISDIAIHNWMADQGFTTMTYEEELEAIKKDRPRENVNVDGADKQLNTNRENGEDVVNDEESTTSDNKNLDE